MNVTVGDLIEMAIEDRYPGLEGHVSVKHDPRPRGKGQHHFHARRNGSGFKVKFFVPADHPNFSDLVSRAGQACAEMNSGGTADEIRMRQQEVE